jgi:hypothetical protein
MSQLIKANLEILKVGEKKRNFQFIIEELKESD